LNPKRVKGVWNLEEDSRLLDLIQVYGKNWALIAENMDGRSAKQARDRFLNKLDPNLNRSRWTPEEDDQLRQLYLHYGSSWATIAKELPGRSENMVKNRFYSTLKKKLPGKEKQTLVGELYNYIYKLEEMISDTRLQVK
jgi:myb proto-oncogene protein